MTLDSDAENVMANEVTVLDEGGLGGFAANTAEGETWAGLNASVVEDLFNNADDFGGDDTYGNLDADDFNVRDDYSKVDQEELIGDAKAIVMIENSANLGEYKVFELTWDGDTTDETSSNDASVSVTALGSLDFGTSLTDGDENQLSEINLVGSDDYAYLIENGFDLS